MQIPKKAALINDLSGYGRCSLTVAVPVISAMGVQACPVPTSLFSNHTGFPTYSFLDLSEQMPSYLKGWNDLGLHFDGILSGFLSSTAQAQTIRAFLLSQKFPAGQKSSGLPCTTILVDPVLGDHGRPYRTITASLIHAMKELASLADILSPNITEACLLTGTAYQECFSEAGLSRLAWKLHQMGPSKIVITGIRDGNTFRNYISETSQGDLRASWYLTEAAGESRPGTGDIFASILAADAVKGIPFPSSVKKAADFVHTCTAASSELSIPIKEGVCFENFLHLLT